MYEAKEAIDNNAFFPKKKRTLNENLGELVDDQGHESNSQDSQILLLLLG